ncbi:hypothetical protein FisN_8Hu263 [Fistulifera solaris]|jgi:hypothetical protein|uniref:E2F-associated phosphoprotein n=1 Tax=Fistulifera solaris TaxID=1519565 RepID=A0A1Z5JYD9_FISSO|nr:hypothetical protein FisN_8Hu263 [Fistulifera solaris]|eukprot:GAX19040.1 hypothetical protein FisN_8Hu263 [Fistulifera solaris]
MNLAEEPAVADDMQGVIPDTAVVTSGETSDEGISDTEQPMQEEDGNHSDDEEPHFPETDDLYDENADDEDEAYVYSHLRSGVEESVRIQQSTQIQELKVLKPRNSDAILSCPCCFLIVCMDCQRHERYPNQFRAMFVMNIAVKWDHRLVYDERQNMLIEYNAPENTATQKTSNENEEIYYTVCCANCTTTVAALDMEDEVYHFYGCLSTS